MVAAAQMITSVMYVYFDVKNTQYSQTVSDMLLDKIEGEIAGAQVAVTDMIISSDNKAISFYNRYGSPIVITAPFADTDPYIETIDNTGNIINNKGKLVIHYRKLTAAQNGKDADATDWTFDQASYMNYDISKLTFEQYKDGALGTNVIKVLLEIQNFRNGFTYSQERYVECYNFETVQDVSKIIQGTIKPDVTVTP